MHITYCIIRNGTEYKEIMNSLICSVVKFDQMYFPGI